MKIVECVTALLTAFALLVFLIGGPSCINIHPLDEPSRGDRPIDGDAAQRLAEHHADRDQVVNKFGRPNFEDPGKMVYRWTMVHHQKTVTFGCYLYGEPGDTTYARAAVFELDANGRVENVRIVDPDKEPPTP